MRYGVRNIVRPYHKLGSVSNGDYIEFDQRTGKVTLHGRATVFDDMLQPLIGEKLESPSSKITLDVDNGLVDYADNSDLTDFVIMNVQLSNKWKLGSIIYPHVHWKQSQADFPNGLMAYRWQKMGEAWDSAWTYVAIDHHAFTYVSGDLNQISAFGGVTPPEGAGLSDIVQFKLFRDTGNASGLFEGTDPITGDVSFLNFDVHFEMDTLGSDEEYTK